MSSMNVAVRIFPGHYLGNFRVNENDTLETLKEKIDEKGDSRYYVPSKQLSLIFARKRLLNKPIAPKMKPEYRDLDLISKVCIGSGRNVIRVAFLNSPGSFFRIRYHDQDPRDFPHEAIESKFNNLFLSMIEKLGSLLDVENIEDLVDESTFLYRLFCGRDIVAEYSSLSIENNNKASKVFTVPIGKPVITKSDDVFGNQKYCSRQHSRNLNYYATRSDLWSLSIVFFSHSRLGDFGVTEGSTIYGVPCWRVKRRWSFLRNVNSWTRFMKPGYNKEYSLQGEESSPVLKQGINFISLENIIPYSFLMNNEYDTTYMQEKNTLFSDPESERYASNVCLCYDFNFDDDNLRSNLCCEECVFTNCYYRYSAIIGRSQRITTGWKLAKANESEHFDVKKFRKESDDVKRLQIEIFIMTDDHGSLVDPTSLYCFLCQTPGPEHNVEASIVIHERFVEQNSRCKHRFHEQCAKKWEYCPCCRNEKIGMLYSWDHQDQDLVSRTSFLLLLKQFEVEVLEDKTVLKGGFHLFMLV